MKKYAKNPWIVGIGTTVIGGVLLSLVLDWIQGVNLLSTLKTVVKFIFNVIITFLNFEIKVWWILIFIIFTIVALIIIAKYLDAKSKAITPDFLNYTKDFAVGYSWEWTYKKTYEGKYTISELHPVCTKCGMYLKQSGRCGTEMICLRCNTTQKWDESYLVDAQMLFEDNIKKNFFKN